jgi:hypothetical protein
MCLRFGEGVMSGSGMWAGGGESLSREKRRKLFEKKMEEKDNNDNKLPQASNQKLASKQQESKQASKQRMGGGPSRHVLCTPGQSRCEDVCLHGLLGRRQQPTGAGSSSWGFAKHSVGGW